MLLCSSRKQTTDVFFDNHISLIQSFQHQTFENSLRIAKLDTNFGKGLDRLDLEVEEGG